MEKSKLKIVCLSLIKHCLKNKGKTTTLRLSDNENEKWEIIIKRITK